MTPINSTGYDLKATSFKPEKKEGIKANSKEKVMSLFEDVTPFDWEDWKWQYSKRIRSKEVLKKIVNLTSSEEKGIDLSGEKLTMAIPPYVASLIDANDPNCPIRRQAIPLASELDISEDEMQDPCAEEAYSPVHGLVHRYPDRVLFLVNEMCAMYCRHCTRSRMVGDGSKGKGFNLKTYDAAFEYIKAHKEIRDVLISGGDPLLLSDQILESIIKRLKNIEHVELVRIGTRVPVTLPQRITEELVSMLKKYSPVWISIHFNHPKEITKRVKFACDLLADSGIPLGSQTVLLRGINDDPVIMKKLMQELLKIRVRPYYLYQCDPIMGSKHFRVPVAVGINIIEKLRGHTSGYAVPIFVVDVPGGGGKIPLGPEYVISKNDEGYTFRNHDNEQFFYRDPK